MPVATQIKAISVFGFSFYPATLLISGMPVMVGILPMNEI